MKYALQVNTAIHDSSASLDAYHFTCACLNRGHTISRIFFYRDGIYNALATTLPPDDEINLTMLWSKLAAEYQLDLVVCISAAQRRGLLCEDEAKRQHRSDDYVAEGFRIAGLGLWVEAVSEADRVMVFS